MIIENAGLRLGCTYNIAVQSASEQASPESTLYGEALRNWHRLAALQPKTVMESDRSDEAGENDEQNLKS